MMPNCSKRVVHSTTRNGLRGSRTRWNILAQQTLMAQNDRLPGPGESFWTDGWDGYPMARQLLMDTLLTSRARNPLVLSGDVHSFFACELARNPARPASPGNPLVARRSRGSDRTSSSSLTNSPVPTRRLQSS